MTVDLRQLEPGLFVAGQIMPGDLPDLAAQGFTSIVNNRPDGEESGQPTGAAIAAAAAAAGVAYHAVPVTQLTGEAVDAMGAALAGGGKVLAFCRSGTRSTFIWALARSGAGADGDDLTRRAAAAGYDLQPIRRFLR